MLTVFWDSQGVLLARFQKRGEVVGTFHRSDLKLYLRKPQYLQKPNEKSLNTQKRDLNLFTHVIVEVSVN
jgi:hypothetical protein